jgi:uncharacterized protein (DUF2267 family)
MTVPMEYRQASRDFDAFLLDARDTAMLQTTNQAYTMVEAVMMVFRRRLSVAEALAFANVLPPVLRAVFVSGWDIAEPRTPFVGREALTGEVLAFRGDHNVSPQSAIADVAAALHRHVDPAAFARILEQLEPAAREYWRP